jgi:peptidoglycan/LPS O-acetylase OafA/YrhL
MPSAATQLIFSSQKRGRVRVPTRATDSRIKVVDLLRSVSILAVLANHFVGINFNPNQLPPGPVEKFFSVALYRFGLSGAYGVSIFFVLSGFLITRITAERNSNLFELDKKKFYIRRVGRILPLLVLILSIVFTVNLSCAMAHTQDLGQAGTLIFAPDPAKFDLTFFLCLFTLSLNWLYIFSTREFGLQLGILWSIAIEEQFYLFLPLFLRSSGNAKKFVPWLVILILFGPFARWVGNFYARNFTASFTNSFGSFDLIAMGVLLFLVERQFREPLRRKKWLTAFLCLSGFLIGAATYLGTVTGNPTDRVYGPSLLGIGVFLFLLGGLQINFFQKLPGLFTLPGQLSYGMYLYHPLVLYGLWTFFLGRSNVLAFFIYTASTVALAWCSFHYFEEPSNKLIRKRLL